MEKTNNTTTANAIANFCNTTAKKLRECHIAVLEILGIPQSVIEETIPVFPDQIYLFLAEQAIDKVTSLIQSGELPCSIMVHRREFVEFLVNHAVGEFYEITENRFYSKIFMQKFKKRLTTDTIFLGGKYENFILQLK